MSLLTAVKAQSFWIYAQCILLHYLLFRQTTPLSQKHSYYNSLFLHPIANLLPCPLKSKPSKTSQTTTEHPANLFQYTANLGFTSCCLICSISPFPLNMLERAAATVRAGQSLALLHLLIQSVLAASCQGPTLSQAIVFIQLHSKQRHSTL